MGKISKWIIFGILAKITCKSCNKQSRKSKQVEAIENGKEHIVNDGEAKTAKELKKKSKKCNCHPTPQDEENDEPSVVEERSLAGDILDTFFYRLFFMMYWSILLFTTSYTFVKSKMSASLFEQTWFMSIGDMISQVQAWDHEKP